MYRRWKSARDPRLRVRARGSTTPRPIFMDPAPPRNAAALPPPSGAPPHCAAIRIRNVAVGTTKKSTEARSATWFWRKVRQVCEGGFGRHPRPWSSTNASSPQDTRWSAVETHRRVAERRGPKGRGVVAPRRRDPARRGHFPAAGERLSARGAGRVIRAGRETAAEG